MASLVAFFAILKSFVYRFEECGSHALYITLWRMYMIVYIKYLDSNSFSLMVYIPKQPLPGV